MPVFRDYDQPALDAQYNNRAAVPGHEAIIAGWQEDSERARRNLAAHLDLAYGEGPRARLDVFPVADGALAPTLAFIHGGYWQALSKDAFSCVAPGFVEAGVSVAVIGYPLCPDVGFGDIVDHIRDAVIWLASNLDRYGGDPGRLYLAGHSAGGHLTALMADESWRRDELPADLKGPVLKGAISLSGLYELEPIRLSYLNEALGLDPETAAHYAPANRRHTPNCPLLLAVGAEETDEFRRQQSDYAAQLRAAGAAPVEMVPPGLNHFSIVEDFRHREGRLHRAVIELIGPAEKDHGNKEDVR